MKKIIVLALASLLLLSASQSSAAGKASLYFSPASGNYIVGQKVTLNIGVNPGGLTYDTINANVNFPASLLQVQNVSLNPAFSLASPDNTFDNSAGTLSYGGGIPGGSDQTVNFATITFLVKSAGNASVSLDPQSLILNAGDNISSSAGSVVAFTLTNPTPTKTTPTPATKNTPVAGKNSNPTATANPASNQSNAGLASIAPSAIPIVKSNLQSQGFNYATMTEWIIGIIVIAAILFTLYFYSKKWWTGKNQLKQKV